MTEILVTGGAGYIGSHVVRALARMNFRPLVYDNLEGGFREAVADFEFIEGISAIVKSLPAYSGEGISAV
jgi:UDP-glucose 4-epimerase